MLPLISVLTYMRNAIFSPFGLFSLGSAKADHAPIKAHFGNGFIPVRAFERLAVNQALLGFKAYSSSRLYL